MLVKAAERGVQVLGEREIGIPGWREGVVSSCSDQHKTHTAIFTKHEAFCNCRAAAENLYCCHRAVAHKFLIDQKH
jgi:hypothetical protein